jgi:L,D-transpeptidase catalytic domain
MRLLASARALNSACRPLTAFVVLAMLLIAPAAAETPTASTPQIDSTTPVTEWGVSGSAPQTGSSAYTSGKAFSIPRGQQGAAAPPTSRHAIEPSAAPEQNAKTVEPPARKILVVIDKPTQEMKVFVNNVERYTWAVSTGKRGYDTPSGTYTARSMNEIWYSKQWDAAPMPHAIFFTKTRHPRHRGDDKARQACISWLRAARARERQHFVCACQGDWCREHRGCAERRYSEPREGGDSRTRQAAGQAA